MWWGLDPKELHGIWTVTCPGKLTEITPAQLHISFELSLRAGFPPINTVGDPGIQGAVVMGRQGIGVSTPSAAVVAAATMGLASEVHTPKGIMFMNGMLSMIVAAGGPPALVILTGRTESGDGAAPKLHWHKAPATTWFAILDSFPKIYIYRSLV
jgi:hypothetical protein